MNTKSPALHLIAAERQRQIDKGYTAEHDDAHNRGEICWAAICYANSTADENAGQSPDDWPFELEAWQPEGELKNLVKAAALLAAEIDRLLRKEGK